MGLKNSPKVKQDTSERPRRLSRSEIESLRQDIEESSILAKELMDKRDNQQNQPDFLKNEVKK